MNTFEYISEIFNIVKHRVNIVDIVVMYLGCTPEKSGRCYAILSPFKKEKTPSCILYPKTNSFYDFSSGNGGDVIKFVALLYGITNYKAAIMLARDFHIKLLGIKKVNKKESRLLIRKDEEAGRLAHIYKNRIEILYCKLIELYRCFEELKEEAEKAGVNKQCIEYQFIRFNYEFFDFHSEHMAMADTAKQIDYVLNIEEYYKREGREFINWIKLMI